MVLLRRRSESHPSPKTLQGQSGKVQFISVEEVISTEYRLAACD